jgi:hypothetical protein
MLMLDRPLAWPGADTIGLVVTDGPSYNEAVRLVTRSLVDRFGHGVYWTANRPHHLLADHLSRGGVDPGSLQYVDCVSAMTGVMPPPVPGVQFIESPTMMEKALLRTDQLVRRLPAGKRFLVLDSLSTLSVYNGAPAVSELSHTLITKMRMNHVPTALILVERQADGELMDQVRPLCDDVLHLA